MSGEIESDSGAGSASSLSSPHSASASSPHGIAPHPHTHPHPPPISHPSLRPDRPLLRADIAVTDPERKGEGLQQYVCYKISSTIEWGVGVDDSGSSEDTLLDQSVVVRRFSDFEWLANVLARDLPSQLIPALPDKSVMNRFTPEFIESRRQGLQRFLERLLSHPVLRRHQTVHVFLHGSGRDMELEKAKTQRDTNPAKSIMSFFSSAAQAVQTAISPGASRPLSESDVASSEMSVYTGRLQNELSQLEQQVEAWLAKEKAMSRAWADMGAAATMLARAEGTGRRVGDGDHGTVAATSGGFGDQYVAPPVPSASTSPSFNSFSPDALGLGGDRSLSHALALLGVAADQLSMSLQRKGADEEAELLEPLKDSLRTAGAVERMLQRRSSLLSSYHSSLSVVDHALSKLSAARSTPGKEGKVAVLESSLALAEETAERKRQELEIMSDATRAEFQRAQMEKQSMLKQVVQNFLQLQIHQANQAENIWNNVLQQIQAQEGQEEQQ